MKTARKVFIGLSPRLHRAPEQLGFEGKTLQYLEQSVAHWVMSSGAMVAMLPTVLRDDARHDLIDAGDYADALDGLLLQGGADIDPGTYGQRATEPSGTRDDERDRFELALVDAFIAAGKPVLGICRGMQLINVALGGTLHQDLRDDGVTTQAHTTPGGSERHAHPVRLVESSWLRRLHGGTADARVTSIHHQGVDRLGHGLQVQAVAEDGVIEAIRLPTEPFVVGVQWHPEFHHHGDGLLDPAPLMRAFVETAARAGQVPLPVHEADGAAPRARRPRAHRPERKPS